MSVYINSNCVVDQNNYEKFIKIASINRNLTFDNISSKVNFSITTNNAIVNISNCPNCSFNFGTNNGNVCTDNMDISFVSNNGDVRYVYLSTLKQTSDEKASRDGSVVSGSLYGQDGRCISYELMSCNTLINITIKNCGYIYVNDVKVQIESLEGSSNFPVNMTTNFTVGCMKTAIKDGNFYVFVPSKYTIMVNAQSIDALC